MYVHTFVGLLEESNIHTVLEMLASSPGSPNTSKYSTECFKGAIKCLFCQSKSSITTVGGSTGCITVTTTSCITNKLKQLSVSLNYFQISGLAYIVQPSTKEWATYPPTSCLTLAPCCVNCSPIPPPPATTRIFRRNS